MAIVKIYFELLGLIPIPFRVSLFIFLTSLFGIWAFRLGKYLIAFIAQIGMKLAEWGTRLLLLPEFLLMQFLRLVNIKYIPGAGVYDDIVLAIGGGLNKFFGWLKSIEKKDFTYPGGLIFLVMIVVVIAWYLMSTQEMMGTLTSGYIAQFFTWYFDLESWALSYVG